MLDGGNLEKVVTSDPTLAHAAWAGGDAVVYDSESTPVRTVYLRKDYHDDDAYPIAPGSAAGSADAAVSADGRLAAFAASMPLDGRAMGLSVASVDRGTVGTITPPGAAGALVPFDDWPSFSPDGKRIVYLRVSQADDQGNPTTGGYFVVDVAGGTSRRITADLPVPGPPRFSPDGRRVLFDQRHQPREVRRSG